MKKHLIKFASSVFTLLFVMTAWGGETVLTFSDRTTASPASISLTATRGAETDTAAFALTSLTKEDGTTNIGLKGAGATTLFTPDINVHTVGSWYATFTYTGTVAIPLSEVVLDVVIYNGSSGEQASSQYRTGTFDVTIGDETQTVENHDFAGGTLNTSKDANIVSFTFANGTLQPNGTITIAAKTPTTFWRDGNGVEQKGCFFGLRNITLTAKKVYTETAITTADIATAITAAWEANNAYWTQVGAFWMEVPNGTTIAYSENTVLPQDVKLICDGTVMFEGVPADEFAKFDTTNVDSVVEIGANKETTLTPSADGSPLTWAGAWNNNAPETTEAATLIVTQDVTLDIGEATVSVVAVEIKKGENVTTTPTLTLVNVANLAPSSGILLEGVNLAFAGTTEADATTTIAYPIMGAGAVTVTEGTVALTSAENTFDGGVTVASKAVLNAQVTSSSVFGSGVVTVYGTLSAKVNDCLAGATQIVVKEGGVLSGMGVHNTIRSAKIHLEEGAVANFNTQYGLASGTPSAVFTGAGTVNVAYTNSDLALPEHATFDSTVEGYGAWTGTVRLAGLIKNNFDLACFTSSSSTLVLAGLTGYTQNGINYSGYMGNLVIEKDTTWLINNGNSSSFTTIPKISGEGALNLIHEDDSGNPTFTLVAKDFASFAGDVTVDDNYSLVVGDDANNRANGKIVVNSGKTVTIAPGKTWSMITTLDGATQEMLLNGTLDLTAGEGLSTIDGALAGNGTVKIGASRSLKVTGDVATTVNFTTEVAGKIVAKTTDDTGTTYTLTDPKVAVGNAQFGSLAEAIVAAQALAVETGSFEQTITLLDDLEEDVTTVLYLTLDLGGHTLTGAITVADFSTLTVKNGTVAGSISFAGSSALFTKGEGAVLADGIVLPEGADWDSDNLTLGVAKIDKNYYATFESAVSHVTDTATIVLLKDVAIPETGVEILAGQEVTLNTNGKAISGTGALIVNGTLTVDAPIVNIAGTGKIVYAGVAAEGVTTTWDLTVPAGMTVVFKAANATTKAWTDKSKITLEAGSVFELATGFAFITIDGTAGGETIVTDSFALGSSNGSCSVNTDLAVADGASLQIRGYGASYNVTVNNLTLLGSITHMTGEGWWEPFLTIAGTLKGGKTAEGIAKVGSIACPVVFADTATLDTTFGSPTITKTYTDTTSAEVTLGNTLTVKVDAVTADAILAAGTITGTPTGTIYVGEAEEPTSDYELKVDGNSLYIVQVVTAAEVASEEELVAALENAAIKTITATADFTIAGTMTLAPGKTFVIPEGKTVTAEEKANLYIQGDITVEGTLNGYALPYGDTGLVANQGGKVNIAATGHVVMPKVWEGYDVNPATSPVVGTCTDGAKITIGDAEVWNYTNGAWVKEEPDVPEVDFTNEATTTLPLEGTFDSSEAALEAAEALDYTLADANLSKDYFTWSVTAGEGGAYTATLVLNPEAVKPVIANDGTGMTLEGTTVTLKVKSPKPGLWYGYAKGTTLDGIAIDAATFKQATAEGVTLGGVSLGDAPTGFFKIVVLPYNPNATK